MFTSAMFTSVVSSRAHRCRFSRKALAMGAASVAPLLPCSTSTAKATGPCQPTNQAWVAGGLPDPYSAVPVLPYTGPPGTPLIAAAVSYTHLRAHEPRHDLVCRL